MLFKFKYLLKIYVWVVISKCGVLIIKLFEGIMDFEFYMNIILRDILVLFIEMMFGLNYWF